MATGFPVKANYATGDVLTAANMNDLSGTVNYLQYMPPRNPVLNSAFNVWQRGTSIAVSASSVAYTTDRWMLSTGASQASTVSRQATGDTTNLPNIQYCARVQRNSGQTGTAALQFAQSFESINAIPFAGKTVTLSFYARAGANFSAASSQMGIILYSGTGTDQNLLNGGYTGAAQPINQNPTLTTTWQRFSYSGTIATTATELAINAYFVPVGTASTNDYFEITGVQLELGSVANTYMPNQPTYQGELAACQRYYLSWVSGNTLSIGVGFETSVSTVGTLVNFPVTMRTTPSLVASSGTNYYRFERNASSDDFNSLTIWNATPQSTGMYNNTDISGTAGWAGFIYTNNASASVAFNAEL